MDVVLCSSPSSVHTQTYMLSTACLCCFFIVFLVDQPRGCLQGLGPVGADRGRAGGCICQGTSFRGPAVAWLSFHVCLQRHSPVVRNREKTVHRQWHCHCQFPMCPLLIHNMWMMEHVNSELLFTSLSIYGMYTLIVA